MTYTQVLLLTQTNGEKILSQTLRSIITDKHRYLRGLDAAESEWQLDTAPGAPEERYTKGGKEYVWKRQELPDDVPLVVPEGT